MPNADHETDRDNLDRPLSADEVVFLDNQVAREEAPERVATALSTRLLHLQADRRAITRAMTGEDSDDVTTLRLAAGTGIGLAGRTGERVAAETMATTQAGHAEGGASCPGWASRVYHPKLSTNPASPLLRRADGTRLQPTNSSYLYGPDDRRVFYPTGYPWHCIGKVDVYPDGEAENPTSWGSGVLIGDRLVLTAGHVPPVNPPSGKWKMRFTAGLYDGSPVDGPGAVSYVSDFRGYLGGVSSRDYAVLRLYEPLGSYLGYFGWKTYTTAWNGGSYWWLAGYPFDVAGANRPSYQNGIPVLDADSDSGGLELEHHGDIASGDSGGPFWGFWGDGFPYVVGTTSGHETISGPAWTGGEDNNIEAGGNELSNLLAWGRNTWPL